MAKRKRKPDLFELMTEDDLLEQFFGNPPDTPAHQQAEFLINYRQSQRQARFNLVVTIATVVMAIQAIVSVAALFR